MYGTHHTHRIRSRWGHFLCVGLAAAAAGLVAGAVATRDVETHAVRPQTSRPTIRIRTIAYRSHGVRREATVVLPASYGRGNNPPIPLVISPHGRNVTGRENARYWGTLPAVGGFAVVSPDGRGRRLATNSFGYPGQIDDLARMPEIVTAALPWLRIDRHRIFALGSSMGGQETLLLVARHPDLLAGAVAMDAVTDLARRYRQMPEIECGRRCLRRFGEPYGLLLQRNLAREVGGTPARDPRLYAARSPLKLADRIASSDVPLQIWWSTKDRIVIDQAHQSGALFRALRRFDVNAPVSEFVGSWRHSHEMRSTELLPVALERLGLLPRASKTLPASVAYSGETPVAV
jgi:dipeptidyl aminopeptidase/acylaminoacyl peptidase